MRKTTKTRAKRLLLEFLKLQLAGNIPFWGTYFGFMLLDKVLHWPEFYALATATIVANIVFFIVDDKWVFATKSKQRKSRYEFVKFVVFMSASALTVFSITTALSHFAGVTPYIGQFISATMSTAWVFIGLRFWVFNRPQAKTRRANRRVSESN